MMFLLSHTLYSLRLVLPVSRKTFDSSDSTNQNESFLLMLNLSAEFPMSRMTGDEWNRTQYCNILLHCQNMAMELIGGKSIVNCTKKWNDLSYFEALHSDCSAAQRTKTWFLQKRKSKWNNSEVQSNTLILQNRI